MSVFLNITTASSRVKQGILTEPPVDTSPISILVIGDSIANGTNEIYANANTDDSIQGIANANTFFEWDGSTLFDRVGGDTIGANNGSQYPSMANKFKELTGRATHIVETATGGDGFARVRSNNWTATGNRYAPMLTKANSYLTDQGLAKFTFIKLIGAINDVNSDATIAQIDEDINDLVVRLHADLPDTPLVFSNIYSGTVKRDAVRAIIQNIIDTDPLVFAGEDLQNFNSGTHLFDGLHLYQASNNLFGEADAVIINNTVL